MNDHTHVDIAVKGNDVYIFFEAGNGVQLTIPMNAPSAQTLGAALIEAAKKIQTGKLIRPTNGVGLH